MPPIRREAAVGHIPTGGGGGAGRTAGGGGGGLAGLRLLLPLTLRGH